MRNAPAQNEHEIAIYSICLSQTGSYDKAIEVLPEEVISTYKPYEEQIPETNSFLYNFALWYNTYLRGNMVQDISIRNLQKIWRYNRNDLFYDDDFFDLIRSYLKSFNSIPDTLHRAYDEELMQKEVEWDFIKILQAQVTYFEKLSQGESDKSFNEMYIELESQTHELNEYNQRMSMAALYSPTLFDTVSLKAVITKHNIEFSNICCIPKLNTGFNFDVNIERQSLNCLRSQDVIERNMGHAWLSNYYFNRHEFEKAIQHLNSIQLKYKYSYSSRYYETIEGLKTYALLKKYYFKKDRGGIENVIKNMRRNPVIEQQVVFFGDEYLDLILELHFTIGDGKKAYIEFLKEFGIEL